MRDRNFHPMFTTLLRVTFAQVMTKSKEVVFIGTRFTRAGWPIKTSSTFVSNKMKVDGKFGRKKNKLCNYGLYSIRQTCAAVVISAVFTAILTHPTCIWRPSRGWHRSNFAEIFGIRKLESLSYRVVLYIFDPVINRFSKTPTCVRQTDTDRHRPMAITSHA